MSRHDKHHHHTSKSRIKHQKKGLVWSSAGGILMLVGLMSIAADFDYWWLLTLAGLAVLIYGIRQFGAR